MSRSCALTTTETRGHVLAGGRGYRPAAGPDAAAAAQARREAAERAAHRLALEVERLRAEGVLSHAAIARVLTERGVPTPRGGTAWTHTTVARVLARAKGCCTAPDGRVGVAVTAGLAPRTPGV